MLVETTVSSTMVRIDLLRLTSVAGRHVERLLRMLVFQPVGSVAAALTGLIKLHIARLFAQVHDRCVAWVLTVFEDLGSVHIW